MHPNCLTEYVEKTPLEGIKNLHQVYMQEQYPNILKEIRSYVKNGKTEVNPEPKKIDEMRELYQQFLEQTKVDAEKIYISILDRVRFAIKAGDTYVRVCNNWQNKHICPCIIELFVKDGFTVVEYAECFDVKGWS